MIENMGGSIMKDWKADLEKIKLNKSKAAAETKNYAEPLADECLSIYEALMLTQKQLAAESVIPLKTRDIALVLHLQKRVQFLQKLYQEEVAKYRKVFPEATHEGLSKKVRLIRLAKEEQDRKKEIAEITLAQEEEKRLAKEVKKLVTGAKRLIRDKQLVVCTACKYGRLETDCPACDGTGEVEPYAFPVIKQVIDGAHSYIVKTIESRTRCPEKKCYGGVAFVVCPHCAGLEICTKDGRPLHKRTREKRALITYLREFLGL